MSLLSNSEKTPSWQLTQLLKNFLQSESRSGFILIICTLISLVLANSALGASYTHLWHEPLIGSYSAEHLINDGLMTLFFLMVGLEIEREIYLGELSDIKAALLPIFAALGGMACPALMHWLFNMGEVTAKGAGIPMATDIAFALGILMLVGKSVPITLKIFLTALAIIDDLGSIFVIAIFYNHGLSWTYLGAAIAIFIILGILNRLDIRQLWPYLILGVIAWYCMLNSGIHATLTGVALAFLVPFRKGGKASPSYILEHRLSGIVAFVVLPLFALANTAIIIPSEWSESLLTHNSLGILAGLMVGKPLGVFMFSLLAVKLGMSQLPEGMNWRMVFVAGIFGGIGFTMSMFVTLLAFDDPALVVSSKIAIMIASGVCAIIGFVWLKFILHQKNQTSS
jgi:NhaA family Na+:H+ antiporter